MSSQKQGFKRSDERVSEQEATVTLKKIISAIINKGTVAKIPEEIQALGSKIGTGTLEWIPEDTELKELREKFAEGKYSGVNLGWDAHRIVFQNPPDWVPLPNHWCRLTAKKVLVWRKREDYTTRPVAVVLYFSNGTDEQFSDKALVIPIKATGLTRAIKKFVIV